MQLSGKFHSPTPLASMGVLGHAHTVLCDHSRNAQTEPPHPHAHVLAYHEAASPAASGEPLGKGSRNVPAQSLSSRQHAHCSGLAATLSRMQDSPHLPTCRPLDSLLHVSPDHHWNLPKDPLPPPFLSGHSYPLPPTHCAFWNSGSVNKYSRLQTSSLNGELPVF